MGTLTNTYWLVRNTFREWLDLQWQQLTYGERDSTLLVFAMIAVLAVAVFALRSLRGRAPGRTHIALPAIPPGMRQSYFSFIRHTPFVLFLAGLVFFGIALADPYTALSRSEVSYPGRRIAIVIDASLSMMSPFTGTLFKAQGGTSFMTNAAAADYFMRMRIKGRYRDLISLIEFGNEAYVITPFTSDYNNVLLSMQMIGDYNEWQRFPDQGTVIMRAIDQAVNLFQAYDFLKSSGNIMVIFTDGQDTNVTNHGMSLEQVVSEAVRSKVPVYLIRTSWDRKLGDLVPDRLWSNAVRRTGGKFYAAANDETIMQAVKDIDLLATGRIDVREYSVHRPRFSPYALMAVALWTLALTLQLTVRQFRTFP